MTSHTSWKVTYIKSDTAVLRIGPLHIQWSPASTLMILLVRLLPIAIYASLFVWYASTSIAYVYPDGNGNWWSGFLHGFFVIPSMVVSLFNHDITIYQSPNEGLWYNVCFLLGIGALISSTRSSD